MRIALVSAVLMATLASVVTGLPPSTPVSGPVADERAPSAVTYVLPVAPPTRVVAAFDPPTTRYGAGHRGVDLAVARHGRVLAAADGVVSFAGQVAGRGVVVIAHADGIRTEYEPLRVAVSVGARVRRGVVLGVVLGQHRTCPPDACLHWSARRGDDYLDPMSLLGGLGPVRLIPW